MILVIGRAIVASVEGDPTNFTTHTPIKPKDAVLSVLADAFDWIVGLHSTGRDLIVLMASGRHVLVEGKIASNRFVVEEGDGARLEVIAGWDPATGEKKA
jgi:hypothetical protein